MKKICFMLACLLLISNTPSFAMKIIVNDENSRIVPSRSTSHHESEMDALFHAQRWENEHNNGQHHEDFNPNQNPDIQEHQPDEMANEHPVNYVRKHLTEEEISNLSRDFRNELIGTYWNYAELEAQRKMQEPPVNEEPVNEEIAEEPINEEIADTNNNGFVYDPNRRSSREAADYYMIDSIKDPNNAVPSGYPQ